MPDIIELCHALQAKQCTESIWQQIQIKYAAFDGDIDHDMEYHTDGDCSSYYADSEDDMEDSASDIR